MSENSNDLSVNFHTLAYKIFIIFLGIEFTFLFLDIVINYNHFFDYRPVRKLFNIAREDSLSSWFMSAQTLLVALVLWFTYFIQKKKGEKKFQNGWLILASFFTYMAADDGASIHERLGSTLKL